MRDQMAEMTVSCFYPDTVQIFPGFVAVSQNQKCPVSLINSGCKNECTFAHLNVIKAPSSQAHLQWNLLSLLGFESSLGCNSCLCLYKLVRGCHGLFYVKACDLSKLKTWGLSLYNITGPLVKALILSYQSVLWGKVWWSLTNGYWNEKIAVWYLLHFVASAYKHGFKNSLNICQNVHKPLTGGVVFLF